VISPRLDPPRAFSVTPPTRPPVGGREGGGPRLGRAKGARRRGSAPVEPTGADYPARTDAARLRAAATE
jgi:hypothetical protein